MYRDFLYSDITLAVLIPFCILIVLKVGMTIIAKVKRQRQLRLVLRKFGVPENQFHRVKSECNFT